MYRQIYRHKYWLCGKFEARKRALVVAETHICIIHICIRIHSQVPGDTDSISYATGPRYRANFLTFDLCFVETRTDSGPASVIGRREFTQADCPRRDVAKIMDMHDARRSLSQ